MHINCYFFYYLSEYNYFFNTSDSYYECIYALEDFKMSVITYSEATLDVLLKKSALKNFADINAKNT